MSDFPSGVYAPRTKANRPGVVYDPDNQYAGYAEDVTNLDAEVVAIEQELGLNPKGTHADVAARLDVLEALASIKALVRVGGADAQYVVDGTADEVQVNAAIADVSAAGGGVVLIDPITFNCAADVLLDDDVNLEGFGWNSVLAFTASNTRVNCIGKNNWKITNLCVDTFGKSSGYSTTSSEGTIRTYGCQHFEISGCKLNCYGFGVFVGSNSSLSSQAAFDGKIHHNFIHGACGNDLVGGGPNGDSDPAVYDIIAHHNYIMQDYSLSTKGSYYNAMDITGGSGIRFSDNIVYGNVVLGSERDPDQFSTLSNNIVYPPYSSTTIGCVVVVDDTSNTGDTSGKNNIIGNIVNGGGIQVKGKSGQPVIGAVINGNTCIANGSYTTFLQHGIYLNYADKCVGTGNNCFGNGATGANGILLTNSNYNSFSGGLVDNYPVGIQASGTSTYNSFNGVYVSNCTATIGSAVLTGVGNSVVNCYGINPDNLVNALGSVSGTVTFDRATGDLITCTASGNITTTTMPITRVPTGSRLTIQVTQGSGGQTIAKPANAILVGGAFSPSAGAGAVDSWTFVYNGTKWQEISRSLNVS